MAQAMMSRATLKKIGLLFATGAAGIVSLVPVIEPVVRHQIDKLPNPPKMSLRTMTLLSMIQPAVLLAGAAAVGVRLAPRLGFRSHLVEWVDQGGSLSEAIGTDIPTGALVGAAAGLATVGADLAFRPWVHEQVQALETIMPRATMPMVVTGVLYGGITEEVMMRWGLMTTLVWSGCKLVRHPNGHPSLPIVQAAIGGTALLFGASHLPATAAAVGLTPMLVLRALVLNGIFGVLAGWVYWRRSLEAAMICHATGNTVLTVIALMVERHRYCDARA